MNKVMDELKEVQVSISREAGLIYFGNGSDDEFWEDVEE